MTRIRIVASTGSTNSDLIADENASEGDWLIALHQTAGKGRQGREWVSADGNFYGSNLVELRSADPSAPTLSLVAGLALIEALDVAAPGLPLMLKWPNDLMLDGRKLAGILLERRGDRVAIGFGVNLGTAPEVADRQTASLGGQLGPKAFAPLLAASFARLLASWRNSDSAAFAHAWERRAHPVGTSLTVHVRADEALEGRFGGIDPDGALRLILDGGSVEIVRAADVSLA